MKTDLTCPVETVSVALNPDSAGHARAALKIRNIHTAEVGMISGHAIWSGSEGDAPIRTDFSCDGMAFEPGAVIDLKLAASGIAGAPSVEIYYDSVLTRDGNIWTADPDRLRDIPEMPRLTGSFLNRLSRHAGEDAVRCAEKYEDGTWMCVCGRLNLDEDTRCRRCGRDMEATLRDWSPEAVEALPYIEKENDISMPFDDDQEEPAPAPSEGKKERRSYALTLLFFAILFALAALGVRILRYRLTGSAGLMPTSFADIFRYL